MSCCPGLFFFFVQLLLSLRITTTPLLVGRRLLIVMPLLVERLLNFTAPLLVTRHVVTFTPLLDDCPMSGPCRCWSFLIWLRTRHCSSTDFHAGHAATGRMVAGPGPRGSWTNVFLHDDAPACLHSANCWSPNHCLPPVPGPTTVGRLTSADGHAAGGRTAFDDGIAAAVRTIAAAGHCAAGHNY